jgi:hypothetical protein
VSNHRQSVGKGKVATIYTGARFLWRDKYTQSSLVCQVYQPWERGLKHFTCMLPHAPIVISSSNIFGLNLSVHFSSSSSKLCVTLISWLNQLAKSSRYTGLDRSLELQEAEAPRSSRQWTHEGVKEVSSSHRPPLPQEIHIYYSFISVAESTPGPQGIKTVNFRLVAQCFNSLRHRLPRLTPPPSWYYV